MRSWSTISAAVGVLAFGAASAHAETMAPHNVGSAASSWLWNLPSIGRLGPLGTSNPVYSLAVHGGTALSRAKSNSSAASSDSSSGHAKTFAIIGGSALGLGVFIAAISGGSHDALTTPPPGNGDNSGTPFTPGGNTGTPGGPGGVNTDTGGPHDGPGGSVDGPTTVTPEPASMALLASGLAGMGGLQFRRNRKRSIKK